MNTQHSLKTFFNSPERSSNEDVLKVIEMFKTIPLVSQLLEGFPDIAVILNGHRQLVAFNSKALISFDAKSHMDILGKRLGEALNCIHSTEMEAGCGTSLFCRECGAQKAIKITTDLYLPANEECRITITSDGNHVSLDLFVHTESLKIDDDNYTMFAARDISHEKRREALERIFFHDILNTASAINGLTEILSEVETEAEKNDLTASLKSAADQLLNEIIAQRELRSAENGQLHVKSQILSVNEILSAVYNIYKNHELAKNKLLSAVELEENIKFVSDGSLLIRSLGNLVKNALEATAVNETVKIFSTSDSESISFHVQNDIVIPKNVQLQLFQRSFSTKQTSGRGIGLYSVKLIIDQYLKGKVGFVSNESEKTIFTIRLKINPN